MLRALFPNAPYFGLRVRDYAGNLQASTPGVLNGYVTGRGSLLASVGLAGALLASTALTGSFPFVGTLPGAGTLGGALAAGGAPAFQADLTSISALPSQISFSRAGNATMYDSGGKLTYGPNNLIPWSDDMTNAVWSNSTPSGSVTASTVTFTGAGNDYRFQNDQPCGLGVQVIASVTLSAASPTTIVLRDAYNGVATVCSVTTTPTRFSLKYTLTAGFGHVQPGLDNRVAQGGDGLAKTITATGWQVEAVTYETSPRTYNATTSSAYYGPRLDYDPTTLQGKGLLIEEQRTNLLVFSQDMTAGSGWSSGANITTVGGVSDPAGTNNATTLTATGSGGFNASNYFYRATTGLSVGATYTNSLWMRRRAGSGVVSLSTPAATQNNVTLTSSWQRLSIAGTVGASSGYMQIDLLTSGDQIDIFGAQLELGAFATSYIPTTSAAVTRSADIAQLTGSAATAIQTLPYSLVGEAQMFGAANWNALIMNGSNQDWIGIWSTNTNSANSTNAVGVDIHATFGSGDITTPFRLALAGDNSSLSLVANNGSVVTDANAPRTTGTPFLGSNSNAFFLNGWVRKLAIYNTRLADATLQSKSVVGAAF